MKKKTKKKPAKKKASKPAVGKRNPGHKYKPGNHWWEVRSSHGRNPIFATPDDLLDASMQYFQWVEKNPLMAVELVKYQGDAEQVEVPKMRAMTISGLCRFLDIDQTTWGEYRKKPDFSPVVTRVEEIIRDQKFVGAAADLLNPNIIARDLGLRDGLNTEHSGSVDINQLTDAQLDAKIAQYLKAK